MKKANLSVPYPGAKRFQVNKVKEIVKEYEYSQVLEPISNVGILPVNLLHQGLVKKCTLNDIDGIIDLYPEYLDVKDWLTQSMFDLGYHRTVHSHLTNKYRSRYYLVIDEKNNIKMPVARSILDPQGIKDLQQLISQIDPKFYRLLAMEDCYNTPTLVRKSKIKVSDFNSFRGNVFTTKQRKYLKVLNRCNVEHLPMSEFLDTYDKRYRLKTLFIFDPTYAGIYDVNTSFVADTKDMREINSFIQNSNADALWFHDDFKTLSRYVDKSYPIENVTYYPVNNGHRIGKGQKRTGCFVHIRK